MSTTPSIKRIRSCNSSLPTTKKAKQLPNNEKVEETGEDLAEYETEQGNIKEKATVEPKRNWETVFLNETNSCSDDEIDIETSPCEDAKDSLLSMQNESVWIPELNLLMRDKVILQTHNNPLPCMIVNAAQRLLKLQFETEGLQPPYAAWYDMQPVSGPAVQIHSDLMAQHCFITCYRNGRVQVADSDPGYISLPVCDQTEDVYKNVAKYPLLNLEYLQVDRQAKGSYDCVLYAIASAYQLLSNGNVSSKFDDTKMREHLIKCLEDRLITEFPKFS